jgi:hypothetical protein
MVREALERRRDNSYFLGGTKVDGGDFEGLRASKSYHVPVKDNN